MRPPGAYPWNRLMRLVRTSPAALASLASLATVLALASALAACGDDASSTSSSGSSGAQTACQKDTRKDAYASGLAKSGPSCTVKILDAQPAPPSKGVPSSLPRKSITTASPLAAAVAASAAS